MARWWIAVASAWALVPRAAEAYRPFDGTDADTAELGDIELEIGPVQGVREQGSTTYEPGFVFNYGFSAGFELVVDADGDGIPLGGAPSDARFVTDVQVKHVLRDGVLQGDRGPSIALETGPLLPTLESHGVDSGGGWDAGLIVSYRWEPITVHLNFEGIYTRDRDLSGWASAILEGPGSWRVRPVAELLAEHDGSNGELASALAGALWRVSSRVTVDAAARTSRELGVTSIEVRAGVTWAFAI